MRPLPLTPHASVAEPAWSEALVTAVADDEALRLDDGRLARRAASCLLQPQPGDRVLVVALGGGECRIAHVLDRDAAAAACLSVAGASTVKLRAPQVALEAFSHLALRSLGDAEATAAGNLSLQGRNLFVTAADAFVQHAEHWVGRLGHALLEARQLFRLHGAHAIITAEKDVKIDDERISMG
jgi:hypothetical protein